MAFALLLAGGCKTDEDDGGGGGGLVQPVNPPAITAIAGQSSFTGDNATVVAHLYEATDLFNGLTNWNNGTPLEQIAWQLAEADEAAQNAAFTLADQMALLAANMNNKSASYEFTINNSTSLASEITNVTAGTITGSHKQSMSHSRLTIGELFNAPEYGDPGYDTFEYDKVGDRQTNSVTANRIYTITGGYIAGGSYKVSGIINIEYSKSDDYTVKDKVSIGNDTNYLTTGSTNDVSKVAVTLLVSDGSRAAKFTFSTASSGSWNQRSADWSGGNNYTDVEVYSPAGAKLYTIPAHWVNGDSFRRILIDAIF